MKHIQLTRGFVAIIDDEDFELVINYKWYAKKGSGRKGSVDYPHNWKIGSMHRLIMGYPKGMQIDHINNDPMDNRRCNLRVCTVKENLRNRKPRLKSSMFLGVAPSLKKWQASIGVDYKRIYLGTFETQEEAAVAYDAAAQKHFGEFANLNFKQNAGNI